MPAALKTATVSAFRRPVSTKGDQRIIERFDRTRRGRSVPARWAIPVSSTGNDTAAAALVKIDPHRCSSKVEGRDCIAGCSASDAIVFAV